MKKRQKSGRLCIGEPSRASPGLVNFTLINYIRPGKMESAYDGQKATPGRVEFPAQKSYPAGYVTLTGLTFENVIFNGKIRRKKG